MFNLNQPYGLYHADTNVRAFCDSERVDIVWMLCEYAEQKKLHRRRTLKLILKLINGLSAKR